MSDIYLSITETPTVVTLSQPVVSGVLSSNVTVTNVVSVNVVTMPAITVQAAAPAVTTVAGTVAVSNFPASQVVSVSNFPASSSVTIGGFSTSSLPPSTVTVANTVTIGNFPSTQTIAGTVTANGGNFVFSESEDTSSAKGVLIGFEDDASTEYRKVTDAQPLPISISAINNTGGFVASLPVSGTVTVGNSVTIGSLPAISGTVTANVAMFTTVTVQTITGGQNGLGINFLNNFDLYDVTFQAPGEYTIQSGFISGGNFNAIGVTIPLITAFGSSITGNYHIGSLFRRPFPRSNTNDAFRITAVTTGMAPAPFTATVRAISDPYYGLDRPISGTVTVGNSVTIGSLPAISGTVTARLQDGSGNNLTSTSIGGVQRLNVSLASAATPGGSLPSFVNVYGGSDGSAVRTISVDSSGRQNINAQFPRVTLIDGSGTVTTANTAITIFASSSTRSYLLVQVTTGSAFVNVGATATTVNGINLTAGQGYSWETTIPQGIVSLISTTTSSRYVAKEA